MAQDRQPGALTDEQCDFLLGTQIPGGSQARAWFLPHEQPKGLANVRDVVRRLVAAATCRQQARIAELEAGLEAIGAGGVEPLRKREHATQLAGQGQHPDDEAVDALAAAMKAKLARQRAKGYGGWDTPECTQQRLSDMLRAHADKGDPVDVANFCAFLDARGEGITPAQAQEDARDAVFKRAEQLVDVIDDHDNNAPEHRCYVSGAYEAVLDDLRRAVVAARAAQGCA